MTMSAARPTVNRGPTTVDDVSMRRHANEMVAAYVEHFRFRVLQDAMAEGTATYWRRRAEQFAAVGNGRCDDIAAACRNRATVALLTGDVIFASDLLTRELILTTELFAALPEGSGSA